MPKQERIKTTYPGVYYIQGISKASGKPERLFYITYRKEGKQIEEKAGKQYSDNMTAAKANKIRVLRTEGQQLSNKERRKQREEIKLAKNIWTINKLWNEFHYQKTEEGLKSLKIDVYRFNKYLSEIFGKKEPKELVVKEIDDFRIMLSKNLKPASVKQVLTLLQRIINFGFNRQLIAPLGFKFQMPKVDNSKTETLSREQLSKLLHVLDEKPGSMAADIMKIALFSGMRKSEIISLKWDDIDFENSFIYIRNPKSGIGEKIPLNKTVKKVIKSQTKTDSVFVFSGRAGNQIVDISHLFNEIKRRAELPKDFRPLHGLRHVYASMLASSGKVDMYTLQKLLTHKSPQMTQRYAHLRDDALKKAADLADEIIEEAGKNKTV